MLSDGETTGQQRRSSHQTPQLSSFAVFSLGHPRMGGGGGILLLCYGVGFRALGSGIQRSKPLLRSATVCYAVPQQ